MEDTDSIKTDSELDRELKMLQIAKMRAEIKELAHKSDRLLIETRWYPLVIVSTAIGVVIALSKLVQWVFGG